jgi:dihydrofolate reductase
MRKLIVTNIVSLDCYYEGPDRNVMVLPMDATFDAYNVERLRESDTLLLGARSYGLFRGFWPPMAEDPDANSVHRELAQLENAMQKVVVSDSITREQTDPWAQTTRILRRAEAHDQIGELKRQKGRDILVFASRTLWNDLLGAGLVDELHFIVGSVILGGGTPAFKQPPPPAGLRRLGTREFEGSDNILVRYAPSMPRSPG